MVPQRGSPPRGDGRTGMGNVYQPKFLCNSEMGSQGKAELDFLLLESLLFQNHH